MCYRNIRNFFAVWDFSIVKNANEAAIVEQAEEYLPAFPRVRAPRLALHSNDETALREASKRGGFG
mgnify:CR=1 FL=1